MADTRDLKSLAKYLAYGFESRLRHFLIRLKPYASKFNAFRFLSVLNSVAGNKHVGQHGEKFVIQYTRMFEG